MLERQGRIEVAPETKPPSPIAFGKWIATLVAIATPLCYLNGRAFHDGYLGRLHLEPTMFPLDAQGVFIDAARAWLEGSATVLNAITKAVEGHWFLIVVLPAVLVTILSGIIHYLAHRARISSSNMSGRRSKDSVRTKLFCSVVSPVFTMFLSAYSIFTLFAVIGAVLLLSIGPFVQVGANLASSDVAKGFPGAPTIELVPPHASPATYRIIECADKFCALYKDGEITTVPVSAITWATSPRFE